MRKAADALEDQMKERIQKLLEANEQLEDELLMKDKETEEMTKMWDTEKKKVEKIWEILDELQAHPIATPTPCRRDWTPGGKASSQILHVNRQATAVINNPVPADFSSNPNPCNYCLEKTQISMISSLTWIVSSFIPPERCWISHIACSLGLSSSINDAHVLATSAQMPEEGDLSLKSPSSSHHYQHIPSVILHQGLSGILSSLTPRIPQGRGSSKSFEKRLVIDHVQGENGKTRS
ncbi:hypothetical protein AOLI_G00125620 [Acnodon oligacanthus]